MRSAARTSPGITAKNPAAKPLDRQPRSRGIHLVTAGARTSGQDTYSPILGQGWLRQQQAREARRLRVGAMALGAAFAPAIWLTHELFVRLRLF